MTADTAPLSCAPTVQSEIARLSIAFRALGLDSPERDARLLVAAALGAGTAALMRDPERTLKQDERERLSRFEARRLRREPVSRILGHRDFFGRTFAIDPATLDPRPETETLVEVALDLARREGWHEKPIRILDIGTGSGCLLVTLLAELPRASGLGTDISGPALDRARANAKTHGVSERARFEQRAADAPPAGTFDLLVSNPPYVRTGDIAGLAPEVRDYDPLSALDGGPDGFDIYRDIARRASSMIPEGWIVMESGAGQAADLAALLCAETGSGFQHLELHRDLGGHIRCVAKRTQRILGVC